MEIQIAMEIPEITTEILTPEVFTVTPTATLDQATEATLTTTTTAITHSMGRTHNIQTI